MTTRNPIQPTTPAVTPPAAAPPSAAAPAPPTTVPPRASNVAVAQRPSPIKRQERDPRGQPDYRPVQIIFLNGPYQGQSIDTGLAVNSSVHEQSANWRDQDAKGIREGINFNTISTREIRLELEFWSLTEDVFHLLENIATTHEIGDRERQPPFLMLVQGSARIAPVVCMSFSHTLSEPHPGTKGYRHGKCELRLRLPGGRDSEHALGKPLVSTPLGDIRSTQTELQRQRQGQRQVAQLLLVPCIGEQGSQRLNALIEQNKLSDPQAIAQLPPETLAQAAISGLFPAEVLSNPALQPRVRAAIASQMAAREPGLGILARQVAQGWLNGGNFAGITDPAILEQARALRPEFEAIATAVTNQTFDTVLEAGNAAGERLRNFGACGLRLRSSGAVDVESPQDEANTLTAINQAIASTDDDAALKQQFGLTTDAEVKALRNGAPYQGRQQLIEHMSQGASIDGVALWSRFEATNQSNPPEPGNSGM